MRRGRGEGGREAGVELRKHTQTHTQTELVRKIKRGVAVWYYYYAGGKRRFGIGCKGNGSNHGQHPNESRARLQSVRRGPGGLPCWRIWESSTYSTVERERPASKPATLSFFSQVWPAELHDDVVCCHGGQWRPPGQAAVAVGDFPWGRSGPVAGQQ